MAQFETVRSKAAVGRRVQLAPLPVYFTLVVLAETVAAYGGGPEGLLLGMGIHVVVLFALLAHSALLSTTNEGLSRLLAVLSLVPLIRVFSLGLPLTTFTIIEWLFLISLPLLAVAFTVMYTMGLRPRDVYLRLGELRGVPIQAAVALSGFGLGVIEFFILLPTEAWIPAFTLQQVLPAALIVGLASGVAEELIFRGLLQPQSERVLGPWAGLVFVALLFAALHIGFRSPVDLAFVFAVGVYFGFVVQRTRSLLGVIFAHGLANMALYLVLPFFF